MSLNTTMNFNMRMCIFVHHLLHYKRYRDILESGTFSMFQDQPLLSDTYFTEEEQQNIYDTVGEQLVELYEKVKAQGEMCTSHHIAPLFIKSFSIHPSFFKSKHFHDAEKEFMRRRR